MMKHVKLYEEYTEVNEANAAQMLSKLGKSAVTAIITYLINNPEVIQAVLNGLLSSGNKDAKTAVKNFK